jgi:site-specific DNA-adenine methylase
MVYMGSKSRIAKYIVPILQKEIVENDIKLYIEPFVGGANVIDKIECERRIASDINSDLIALLKYAQSDTELKIAPEDCPFEHYADVRSNRNTGKYTQEYRALVGYCASYAGRYFEGGYGRDKTGKRNIYKERVKNLKEQAEHFRGIEFSCMDYQKYLDMGITNALFYLDPPYRNTKKYAKNLIDYEEFYAFCHKLTDAGNIVIISEFNMPDGFECIWEKEKKVLLVSDREEGRSVTEKLYKTLR